MEDSFNIIKKYLSNNNSTISTKQINSFGINRMAIQKFVECGKLEKVSRGLYSLPNEIVDEYALIQAQCSKIIFSYGSALFLWGMSDITPHKIDVTILQGTNVTKLKNRHSELICHYVNSNLFELGITQTKSPQGGIVKLYDKERCICDLIKNKNKIDMQLFTQAIKEYFSKTQNYRKLLKYSKIMDIEDKVRIYMEVL